MNDGLVLGLDFGTLSVRALLVCAGDGREVAQAEYAYPHGVMDRALPCGAALEAGFALAHPADYLTGLGEVVRSVMKESGAAPQDVIALGLDATSSTVLPLDADGRPLCFDARFEREPHAYMKLWKHQGAARQAQRMSEAARRLGETWLALCGGEVQCERMLPKVLEVAQCAPHVYAAAARFVELCDYMTFVLTGSERRSLPAAACNGHYISGSYPGEAFWREVDPSIPPVTQKLTGDFVPIAQAVGALTPQMAQELGLAAGIPVAAGMIDSHASAPGCGADRAGDLVAVMGTSACYLMNDTQLRAAPGIYAAAYEAHAQGLYGYEGGQSCVGDALDWFVKTGVPRQTLEDAEAAGMDVHTYLSVLAQELAPGESGLMALDWLAGVRSPLMRPELRGVMAGMTLRTTPQEMYRAWMEACCFGARRIVESYAASGMKIGRFFAAGGIARKNPFFMQMLSDVCAMPVTVCRSSQTGALGSAICAAAASGRLGDLAACTRRMGSAAQAIYTPQNAAAYEPLYRRYLALSAAFESADLAAL